MPSQVTAMAGTAGRCRTRNWTADRSRWLWAPQRDRLLPRQLHRKFAVTNARRQAFGVRGGSFLAVGRDQFGEREEQRGLRQAVAVDAFVPRADPCFLEIAERQPLLFVVGDGFVSRLKLRRNAH